MALVDNAIKFSPRGGDVKINLSANGEKVLVAVEDHGIGITKRKPAAHLRPFLSSGKKRG